MAACGARASRVTRACCCPATPPPTSRLIERRPAPARALVRPCKPASSSPPLLAPDCDGREIPPLQPAAA
eukprot:3216654-Prymnesium_polylepis.1